MNNLYFVIMWICALGSIILSINEILGEISAYYSFLLVVISGICLKNGLGGLEKSKKQYYIELKVLIETLNNNFEKYSPALSAEFLKLETGITGLAETSFKVNTQIKDLIEQLVLENKKGANDLAELISRNTGSLNKNLNKLLEDNLCVSIQKNSNLISLINQTLGDISNDLENNTNNIKRKLGELIECTEESNDSLDKLIEQMTVMSDKYKELDDSLQRIYTEFIEQNEQQREFLTQYQKLSADDIKILRSIYKDINDEQGRK